MSLPMASVSPPYTNHNVGSGRRGYACRMNSLISLFDALENVIGLVYRLDELLGAVGATHCRHTRRGPCRHL